jgi:hypothetical protein
VLACRLVHGGGTRGPSSRPQTPTPFAVVVFARTRKPPLEPLGQVWRALQPDEPEINYIPRDLLLPPVVKLGRSRAAVSRKVLDILSKHSSGYPAGLPRTPDDHQPLASTDQSKHVDRGSQETVKTRQLLSGSPGGRNLIRRFFCSGVAGAINCRIASKTATYAQTRQSPAGGR